MGIIQDEHPAAPTGRIPAWSYSSLKDLAACPYRLYLAKIKRHKKADKSPVLQRGIEVHEMCEQYIKGLVLEWPTEFKDWENEFEELRGLFSEQKAYPECELAFTQDWEATAWFGDDTWARFKADCIVQENETSYRLIDFKTGKKFGNEFSHSQQLQYYAAGLSMAFPSAEFIQAEMWYLDQPKTPKLNKSYTREEVTLFLPKITERGLGLTERETWQATPSDQSCRWCDMKEFCEYSV